MNIRDRKIEMRKLIEHKRSKLTPSERKEKQEVIHHRLLQLSMELFDAASNEALTGRKPTLLTYMPFRSEPDITPLMEWCWKEGVRVLLPRVVPETRSLILHQVDGYDGVDTGAYGIREPRTDMPVERDLTVISMILVPGLAFDQEFGRLGYGGGYYDRFMQLFSSRSLAKPQTVAAAFDVQMVAEVPASWHDFRVDHIITESVQLNKS
jgi:5-formyltetrahydrofolate cyclo-ligase